MAEPRRVTITLLLEEELRLAAKALREMHEALKDHQVGEPYTPEQGALIGQAIDAATAALWGADVEGKALMLTRAQHFVSLRPVREEEDVEGEIGQ